MSNQINSHQFSYGVASQSQNSLSHPPLLHEHGGVPGGVVMYDSGNSFIPPRPGRMSYDYRPGATIEQRSIQPTPPSSSASVNVRESITTTVRREVSFERDATPDDLRFFFDAIPKNNGNNIPCLEHLTCAATGMMHPVATVPTYTSAIAMSSQLSGFPSSPLLPTQSPESFVPTHHTMSHTTSSLQPTFRSPPGVMPYGLNNRGSFTSTSNR